MTSPKTRSLSVDIPNADPLKSQTEALLSHDVRSAVGDIIGALQLMDMEQVGVENRQHMARIGAAAGLLFRLVHPGAPDVDLPGFIQAPDRVRLAELKDDLEKRWQGRARAKKITLEIEADFPADAVWTGDRLALERMLANLLDNAVKFTSQGTVSLGLRARDDALEVSVRDEGPGFSDEALRLLYSFGGRPADSEVPGSGLGLFICKKMATLLGATLRVENASVGACVRAFVPMEATAHQRVQAAGTSPEPVLSGVSILLAEDNKTNQLVASQMLSMLGARTELANDGIEALQLWEHGSFDLALLDIEMPRKSGLELIRDIRSKGDEKSGKPLVALTAYVLAEHRQRIMETGADGIIAKPLMSVEAFGQEVAGYLISGVSDARDQTVKAPQYGVVADVSPVDQQVFNALRDTIGGGAFSELLGKLVQDLADVRERVKAGVADQDTAKIRGGSHVLVSLAGAVGATRLQEAAQSLNTSAHEGDFDKIGRYEETSLALLDELTVFLAQTDALNTGV